MYLSFFIIIVIRTVGSFVLCLYFGFYVNKSIKAYLLDN